MDLACSVGVANSSSIVTAKFNVWLNSKQPLYPDIKNAVYYYGLYGSKGSAEENWNKVWKLYLNELDAQEKSKLLSALSAVQVPWLLNRYTSVNFKIVTVNLATSKYQNIFSIDFQIPHVGMG